MYNHPIDYFIMVGNERLIINQKMVPLDFADIQIQLSSLSDILEQIKTNTTTSSVSSKSIVRDFFCFK
jgi:hypothetical protein